MITGKQTSTTINARNVLVAIGLNNQSVGTTGQHREGKGRCQGRKIGEEYPRKNVTNVIHTDTVFHVLNGERWRWNYNVKTISAVHNDWNSEAVLLQVFAGQLVAIQVQYRDFISTVHIHIVT